MLCGNKWKHSYERWQKLPLSQLVLGACVWPSSHELISFLDIIVFGLSMGTLDSLTVDPGFSLYLNTKPVVGVLHHALHQQIRWTSSYVSSHMSARAIVRWKTRELTVFPDKLSPFDQWENVGWSRVYLLQAVANPIDHRGLLVH